MNKKDLAKKGRFGDTEIRKVDGKPAHVNPQEAKLIDRRGRLGEIIVKSQGAGTVNPQTGMSEYHLWHDHGIHGPSQAMKDSWNKNVKPYGTELAALAAAGITFAITGNPGAALKIGGAVYNSLSEIEQAKEEGKIAADQYKAAKDHFDNTVSYQQRMYDAQKIAYDARGKYNMEVFDSQSAAYTAQGEYLADVYQSQLGAYEREGEYLDDRFESEEDAYGRQTEFLKDTFQSQEDAYGRQGEYLSDTFQAQEDAYAREGDYLEDKFQSEKDRAENLRTAFSKSGEVSKLEQEIMDRQRKIAEEGDPELKKLLKEEQNRALATIRQQGADAQQRTAGHIVGTGLEGSIVARELVRQTDRDTLKSLSETARDLAIKNQRAQIEHKRRAQSSLDTMGLSIEGRKRQSLLNIAGIADPTKGFQGAAPIMGYQGAAPVMGYQGAAPIRGYQGAAPVQGVQGAAPVLGPQDAAPVLGIPGEAPVDTSGLYKPDYFGAAWNIASTIGSTDTDWDFSSNKPTDWQAYADSIDDQYS